MTTVKAVPGSSFGSTTLQLTLPMYEVYRLTNVANERDIHGDAVAQRKLDVIHARKLASYILRGLVRAAVQKRESDWQTVPDAYGVVRDSLGHQPYMSVPPMVANLRSVGKNGAGLKATWMPVDSSPLILQVELGQADILWIVDGQHRRKAMDLVFQFLAEVRSTHKYPKKPHSLYVSDNPEVTVEELQLWGDCEDIARSSCTVNIEVHLGLDVDEERQLFHDLNNLGKKVESSLSLEFDSANPINAFIKTRLMSSHLVRVVSQDVVNWDDDTGALSRKDVAAVNAHLFLNRTNISSATATDVGKREEVAMRFWEAVMAIPEMGEPLAKKNTVAAQPVVLKAIAKLTYDFAFGRPANAEHLTALLDGISDVDFSHDNPMWRYYEMSGEERIASGLDGLAEYVPSEATGNRDLGRYEHGAMRFGAKHNDIFPIIGDMIRWRLHLPNRHSK